MCNCGTCFSCRGGYPSAALPTPPVPTNGPALFDELVRRNVVNKHPLEFDGTPGYHMVDVDQLDHDAGALCSLMRLLHAALTPGSGVQVAASNWGYYRFRKTPPPVRRYRVGGYAALRGDLHPTYEWRTTYHDAPDEAQARNAWLLTQRANGRYPMPGDSRLGDIVVEEDK